MGVLRFALTVLFGFLMFVWILDWVPVGGTRKAERRVGSTLIMQGIASHYGIGDGLHGECVADGRRLNAYAMTAAMRDLNLGSVVLVENPRNGKTVRVKITDWGPNVKDHFGRQERLIDLSYGAAREIGMIREGIAPVVVHVLSEPYKPITYHHQNPSCRR